MSLFCITVIIVFLLQKIRKTYKVINYIIVNKVKLIAKKSNTILPLKINTGLT